MRLQRFAVFFLSVSAGLGLLAAGTFSTSGTLPSGEVTGRMMPLTFTIYDSAAPQTRLWSHSVSVAVTAGGAYYAELSDISGSDLLEDGTTLDAAFSKVTGAAQLAVANQDGRELLPRQELGLYPRATVAHRATRIAAHDAETARVTAGTVAISTAQVSGDVRMADCSSAKAEGVLTDTYSTVKNETSALVLNGGITGWSSHDGASSVVPSDCFCPNGTVLDADAIVTFRQEGKIRARVVRRGETLTYADGADLVGIQKLGGSSGLPVRAIPTDGQLESGRYVLSSDITRTSVKDSVPSGLTVLPGCTVVIELQGHTLTAVGREATGRKGGGAGIEVPSDSTLYLVGPGTVDAKGGAAAGGSNGECGSDGGFNYNNEWVISGSGGRGGDGGGGAGAGIGGRGGDGGTGGAGHSRIYYDCNRSQELNSSRGDAGSSGGTGGSSGRVFILGGVSLASTKGGAASPSGGSGGSASGGGDDTGSGWTYYYTAGGGGGGGGGGSGGAGAAIGGGGFGGGGGAGGSAGGYWWQSGSFYFLDGPGGRGGKGSSDGSTGSVGGSPGSSDNQAQYAEGGSHGSPGTQGRMVEQSSAFAMAMNRSGRAYTSADLVVTTDHSLAQAVEAVNADPNLVDAKGRRRISFDLPADRTNVTESVVISETARSLIIDGANGGKPVSLGNIVTSASLELRNLSLETLVSTNANIRLVDATVRDRRSATTGNVKTEFTSVTNTVWTPPEVSVNFREKDGAGTVVDRTVTVAPDAESAAGFRLATLPYALTAMSVDKVKTTGALNLSALGTTTVENATLGDLTATSSLTIQDGFSARKAAGFKTLELNGGIGLPENADFRLLGACEDLGGSSQRTDSVAVSVAADGLLSLDVWLTRGGWMSPVLRIKVGSQTLTDMTFVPGSYGTTQNFLLPVKAGDVVTVETTGGWITVSAKAWYFGRK